MGLEPATCVVKAASIDEMGPRSPESICVETEDRANC
jgi:hypothetical protein